MAIKDVVVAAEKLSSLKEALATARRKKQEYRDLLDSANAEIPALIAQVDAAKTELITAVTNLEV